MKISDLEHLEILPEETSVVGGVTIFALAGAFAQGSLAAVTVTTTFTSLLKTGL